MNMKTLKCILATVVFILCYWAPPVEGNIVRECADKVQTAIRCPKNGVIQIVYANFGRLDPDPLVCPHFETHKNNINCNKFQNYYTRQARKKCNGKETCTINRVKRYREPCVGTTKYMEVQFECIEWSIKKIPSEKNYTARQDMKFMFDGKLDTCKAPGNIYIDIGFTAPMTCNRMTQIMTAGKDLQCTDFSVTQEIIHGTFKECVVTKSHVNATATFCTNVCDYPSITSSIIMIFNRDKQKTPITLCEMTLDVIKTIN